MFELKLRAGRYLVRTQITEENGRLFLRFPFNKKLMEEIKVMESPKWHGYDEYNPRKIWSIADSQRNRFQLKYLAHSDPKDPENPYFKYDQPLIEWKPKPKIISPDLKSLLPRPLYKHQCDMVISGLTYHYVEWAAEMGTGKTLAAIEVMEDSGVTDWLWVGPKAALYSVQLEFKIWSARIKPTFVTYEGLKKLIADWPEGKPAPQGFIVDEASRCKNRTAQRTQAVQHLSDAIRNEYGDKGFVILMSGSPAPKSPVDWWSQCEIACPGFIREGNPDKFKRRLAIISERESMSGGKYPRLISWKDDERKCDVCGELKEHEDHTPFMKQDDGLMIDNPTYHEFKPSKNEVAFLYKRMAGLVTVKFKKDCLDLPDKVYREIICRPTQSTLNAAKAIEAKASSALKALVLLRELSDGFQYQDQVTGREECPVCHGSQVCEQPIDIVNPDLPFPTELEIQIGHRQDETKFEIQNRLLACNYCDGTGSVNRISRTTIQVPCPKEDQLLEILEEHDDIGRLVVFAGFTGSIERNVKIIQSIGWDFIKVDGHGWRSSLPMKKPQDLLAAFQEKGKHGRVAFVGQPGAAGMGLNLTGSPTVVYYSNDFNAESRIQSEDRIHRPGMDTNKGATIIDLLHLPSDKLILDNLKKKRKLQDLTLGQFHTALAQYTNELREV